MKSWKSRSVAPEQLLTSSRSRDRLRHLHGSEIIVFKMKNTDNTSSLSKPVSNPNGSNSFIRLQLKLKRANTISQIKALKSIVFKLLFIVFTSGFSVSHLHGSAALLNAEESILSNSPPRLFRSNHSEKKIAATVCKTNQRVSYF